MLPTTSNHYPMGLFNGQHGQRTVHNIWLHNGLRRLRIWCIGLYFHMYKTMRIIQLQKEKIKRIEKVPEKVKSLMWIAIMILKMRTN